MANIARALAVKTNTYIYICIQCLFFFSPTQMFSITPDVGSHVGCGLYLQAAAANHSCNPNSSQSFDGRYLSLRCTRPISEGEEITVGITEMHRSGPARRKSLRTSYFFECRCERCDSEGAAEEDARLEGFACADTACPGVCLRHVAGCTPGAPPDSVFDNEEALGSTPVPLKVDSVRLLCSACGASRPSREAEREGKAVYDLLERGKALLNGGKGSEGKKCLDEALQRGVRSLHRGNWVLSEVYAELCGACLELQVRLEIQPAIMLPFFWPFPYLFSSQAILVHSSN